MKNEPIRDEFLEKRKARQRKARKKRFITGLITLSIVLVITAVILCLTVFFPISKITATGSKIYTSEQIVENCGVKIGDNIFAFSRKKASNTLKTNLPFIEKVEFSLKLPDMLKIKVSDAKPYYCVAYNGAYYNVSKAGWVLEKTSEKTDGVFEIKISDVKCKVGSEIVFNDKKSYEKLQNIIALLENNDFKIDYVDVTNLVTIKAGVEGRFDVNFGTENSLENKVLHLKTTIESIPENKSGSINLSMWNAQNLQGTFVENNTK